MIVKRQRTLTATTIIALSLILAAGCSTDQPTTGTNGASGEGGSFLATTEPADAIDVGQALGQVTSGQAVSLVGIIGGSAKPFVDGLAAFSIVDPAVPYCPPEEGCPTPWDYCCTQDQVAKNIATVKLVDESGNTPTTDARQLLGVKELATVVVQGTADVDEAGNLTVAATQIYVRPGE